MSYAAYHGKDRVGLATEELVECAKLTGFLTPVEGYGYLIAGMTDTLWAVPTPELSKAGCTKLVTLIEEPDR